MTQNDKQKFAAVLHALAIATDKELTTDLVDLYFRAMTDLTIEQVENAGMSFLKSSRFFPRIADFYEYAEGSPDTKSEAAWLLLIKAMDQVGAYRSLLVKERPLAYAIESTFGGWVQACAMPDRSDPMHASFRKQFLANYRLGLRDDKKHSTYFAGICEATNQQTAATFSRGLPVMEDEEPCIPQQMGYIAHGQVLLLNVNFNVMTGTLTAKSRYFLRTALPAWRPDGESGTTGSQLRLRAGGAGDGDRVGALEPEEVPGVLEVSLRDSER